jgi:hypothetical protein
VSQICGIPSTGTSTAVVIVIVKVIIIISKSLRQYLSNIPGKYLKDGAQTFI